MMNILYIYYLLSYLFKQTKQISIINPMKLSNLPDIARLANEETRFKCKCAPHACHNSRLPIIKDIITAAGSWKTC